MLKRLTFKRSQVLWIEEKERWLEGITGIMVHLPFSSSKLQKGKILLYEDNPRAHYPRMVTKEIDFLFCSQYSAIPTFNNPCNHNTKGCDFCWS